jgi:propanol-preferring alcohol dehydrogenase
MIGKDVDGGFAEYVKVPASSIVKLPEKLPFEQAAIMGCAVPTAYHALKRGRVRPGETVVVFGIGGLGVHAVQLAERVFKAGSVVAVDVLGWKLKLARQLGAKVTVNASTHDVPEEISRITGGSFADVIIDFVGSRESMTQAIASVGKGGRVVLVGISNESVQISPYKTVIGREMEIIGVDDHLKSELVELLRFVRLRKINLTRSVTHRVRLEIINQGFRILESRREKAIRVVVTNNA